MRQFPIPRKKIIGKLQPKEVVDIEVSDILWTTDGTADTAKSQVESPSMPPET